MATTFYYPEMGEKRPEAEIEARLSGSDHWVLTTDLDLAGRGVKLVEILDRKNLCGPRVEFLHGKKRYRVTENAFRKIEAKHTISCENLL